MESSSLAEQMPRDDEATAEPRLGRADWIEAALQVLVGEGVDGLRITRLADDLAVTRGSFYWHFKDREDLLQALIGHWQRKNTAGIVSAVRDATTIDDGILALFETWLDPTRFDPRLDSAVRDWARRSDALREAIDDADRARVSAIALLFEKSGYDNPEAFIRARVIYFTQIGYYALHIEEPMAERMSYLEAYFKSFTGLEIDPEKAAAYRARHPGGGL